MMGQASTVAYSNLALSGSFCQPVHPPITLYSQRRFWTHRYLPELSDPIKDTMLPVWNQPYLHGCIKTYGFPIRCSTKRLSAYDSHAIKGPTDSQSEVPYYSLTPFRPMVMSGVLSVLTVWRSIVIIFCC